MAMTVEIPALEQADVIAGPASSGWLRRWARPALGLLLPVGLALAWELIVRFGLSSGRLVPPPTRIFATLMDLAKSGELARHVVATLTRVVLQCYYREDRVVRSLGLEPRPPYPKGHVLEDGDWSLLDPVRVRPPMWRRT